MCSIPCSTRRVFQRVLWFCVDFICSGSTTTELSFWGIDRTPGPNFTWQLLILPEPLPWHKLRVAVNQAELMGRHVVVTGPTGCCTSGETSRIGEESYPTHHQCTDLQDEYGWCVAASDEHCKMEWSVFVFQFEGSAHYPAGHHIWQSSMLPAGYHADMLVRLTYRQNLQQRTTH